MGAGIAQVAARGGHPVLLYDVRPGAARTATERVVGELHRQADKGRLSPGEAEAARQRPTRHGVEIADPLQPEPRRGGERVRLQAQRGQRQVG